MKYTKETLVMSDSNKNVFYSWIPEQVDLCVVLSHGMVEHALRYDALASRLSEHNIAFFAEDHRGHGQTALIAQSEGTGMRGFLAEKNGFMRVADDIHEEILEVKKRFPGKKIVLLGHSFGSFIAQAVIEFYGNDVDACILSGTAGPRPLTVGFARLLGSLVKLLGGKKTPSSLLNAAAFGSYNSRIKDRKTDFDWLTRDRSIIDLYIQDEWCGFIPTAGFFCDLFKGLSIIHKKENIARIPENLPVLFIAGKEDPVGSYSKTVKSLYDLYKKRGLKNAGLKLYEGSRHELFNETNRAEVISDVLKLLESLSRPA